MFKEKTFQIALVISILAHGAILYNLPQFNINNSLKKPPETIKIDYQKLQVPKNILTSFTAQKATPLNSSNLDKIYIKNTASAPFFPKDLLSKQRKTLQQKPNFVDKLKSNKKVSVPATETKIKNPTYLNYYQKVREKIRRSAFRNFTKMHSGEVYLTFVILSTGHLQKIKLIEDKTKADNYLKQTAIKSLKESSPFPTFPRELKYPELSFNIIISFEIGD